MENTKIGNAGTSSQAIDWRSIQVEPVKNIKEVSAELTHLSKVPYSIEQLGVEQRKVMEKALETNNSMPMQSRGMDR